MAMTQPEKLQRDSMRERFQQLANSGDSFDLIEGALLLAGEEYPLLNTEAQHTRLRTLCRNAALRAAPFKNPFARHVPEAARPDQATALEDVRPGARIQWRARLVPRQQRHS